MKKFLSTKFNFINGILGFRQPLLLRSHDKFSVIISSTASMSSTSFKKFNYVCVGGTFDRIHAGHEILLKAAATGCLKELTVGVTDETMVAKKVLSELILPTQTRIDNVRNFLVNFNPELKYNIVPISDPFGPAITDPRLQCIVGSVETKAGCEKINEIRKKNSMEPLEIELVELVPDDQHGDEEEEKLSSSSLRMRLLGTELRPPRMERKAGNGPYLIGLVGGSASGKSAIAKRLEGLGAGVVDCDQLGHKAYSVGTDCHKKIVQHFGELQEGLIQKDSGEIDRRVLGSIVFGDQEKLDTLQEIVWPEIWRLTMDRVKELHKSGKEVVVLDAAVLIKAGWHEHVHQVFVCLIDQEEAIKRIVERDAKSPEEAKARLAAQPKSADLMEFANVVLCTKWSGEYTQKQVEKAWNTVIMKYI